MDITSPAEAALLSRCLALQPFTRVRFTGTAACIVPKTVQVLDLRVELGHVTLSVAGAAVQTPFRRFEGCLRPLGALQELRLLMYPWQLTSAMVSQIAQRHPHLSHLSLALAADPAVGMAVTCLQRLSGVQLSLHVWNWDYHDALAVLLRDVPGLQLDVLSVQTEGLRSAEEAVLARCSMKHLIVRCADPEWRMQHPPPGVRVVYQPT